jgi:hypothetical protein
MKAEKEDYSICNNFKIVTIKRFKNCNTFHKSIENKI